MYKAAVIVASDKCSSGERNDESGLFLCGALSENGFECVDYVITPDDKAQIKSALIKQVEADVALVLTTGGTGFSQRDVTPEATEEVIQRKASGIAEAIRQKSLAITPRAMLSRGISGIADGTLIINFPGSLKACKEAFEIVLPALAHGLDILRGRASECAASGKKS